MLQKTYSCARVILDALELFSGYSGVEDKQWLLGEEKK